MTPKLVPTIDTIISEIKSETEFENFFIGITPDPKLETILSYTSLHLPPWILAKISPHNEYDIKTLFKATIDATIEKYHPDTATAPVATPLANPIHSIQSSSDNASKSATATSEQASSPTTNAPTKTLTGNSNPNLNQNIGK